MSLYTSEADLVSDLRLCVQELWGDEARSDVEVRCHDQARMDVLVSTPAMLIAVEAKISHGSRVLAQAFLHRYCVDQVYIALPTAKIKDELLREAARFDIGVISVSNGSARIVQPAGPAKPEPSIRSRILNNVKTVLTLEEAMS